jgi:hypothetical protein
MTVHTLGHVPVDDVVAGDLPAGHLDRLEHLQAHASRRLYPLTVASWLSSGRFGLDVPDAVGVTLSLDRLIHPPGTAAD